ncbi:Guanine nucleotide-binding protein, beta subunit [Parasponia andersonii]|uniref:Cleavage stimulation factor 50 kDa subunit n=1 Tax=Parasponia andersonii TaxID=3476 RepID=A0A2P5BHQ2_PARAD|nr:Guanine nucleotide-binding protein, beta subunit [Parasponia andersonii]
MMLPDARDGPVRSPINDLYFHPENNILISGAKDHTIKCFDISKMTAKRAFRVFQDMHNVCSASFHPFGDFLLAGNFICYNCSFGVSGAIHQVRYAAEVLLNQAPRIFHQTRFCKAISLALTDASSSPTSKLRFFHAFLENHPTCCQTDGMDRSRKM